MIERINYNNLEIKQLEVIEASYSDLLFKLLGINSFYLSKQINNELHEINKTIKKKQKEFILGA